MNTLKLSWHYLWAKPLQASLNIAMLGLGLSIMLFLSLVQSQIYQSFERNLQGIDAVVGAKGSPMQLILSGVFHIDSPTGNIKLHEFEDLQKNPAVAKAIPLSLGDSYRGFRIVGTNADYLKLYDGKVEQGVWPSQALQAVLGSAVATKTGMQVGSHFSGNHGLAAEGEPGMGEAPHEAPYQVVGVLASCQCILDGLILTPTESVWAVHEDAEHLAQKQKVHDGAAEREITLALIQYHNDYWAMRFPRDINRQTNMQAASPAMEVTRLFQLLGVGLDLLRILAGVILVVAALSILLSLSNAMRERSKDLALLRLLGANPSRLAWLVWVESLYLALLGSVLGVALAHGFVALLGLLEQAQFQRGVALRSSYWQWSEAGFVLLIFILASLAAIVPAWQTYRRNVGSALTQM